MLDGTADFDQLLAGRAQLVHPPIGVQWETVLLDQPRRVLHHPAAVDPSQRSRLFPAEKYVFGNR